MSVRKKVLIFDTSILCVWLKVSGMCSAGPDDDKWDFMRVKQKIDEEIENGTFFVLPLAVIIETGNHIAHAHDNRRKVAYAFADLMMKTSESASPWAAFTQQSELWNPEGLKNLALRWRDTAESGQSLGDASIVDVANYYYKMDYEVEIFTGDDGLKAFEPSPRENKLKPRRSR